MVGFMGVAADDLKCPQISELRMTDHGLSRCLAGHRGPFLCRSRQDDQAHGWRELPVAANLSESVLIPAGQAPAGIVSEGEQPLGPNPQDIHQVPHIHRGRPALAELLHRLVDAGNGVRCVLREPGDQFNSVIAGDSPGEAALLAHGGMGLPSHDGSLFVSGHSVEIELVTLDVLHHEARLVGAIGEQQSDAHRAERDQPRAFGLKCGQALFTHEPGADPHVKMQPVLDDLAFGNALEEQSRART
jgi:hypothetical protein